MTKIKSVLIPLSITLALVLPAAAEARSSWS